MTLWGFPNVERKRVLGPSLSRPATERKWEQTFLGDAPWLSIASGGRSDGRAGARESARGEPWVLFASEPLNASLAEVLQASGSSGRPVRSRS